MSEIKSGDALTSVIQAGLSVTQRSSSQAWMRAFERARWEQQPRGHIQLSDEGDSQCGVDASGDRLNAQVPADPVIQTEGWATRGQKEVVAHDQAQAPKSFELRSSAPSIENKSADEIGERTFAPAVPARLVAQGNAPGSIVDISSAAEKSAGPDIDSYITAWKPFNVHVEQDEKGVHVWIRDGSLSAQDSLKVLDRLKRGFKDAVGPQSLGRVTVNGKSIDSSSVAAIFGNDSKGQDHGS